MDEIKSRNFIFGYGSLIERESRLRTTPRALAAPPVIIKGIERGWWAYGVPWAYSTCFLGARISQNEKAICNGVIYEVTDVELEQLDQREAGYDRIKINPNDVTMLDGSELPPDNANIYVYAMPADEQYSVPTPKFPIVQSYVDMCINGCFEIEKLYPLAKAADFAAKFIEYTLDWNEYWVNDRLYPRRPFIYQPNAYQIDYLLHTHIPEFYSKIKLQPANWD